MPSHASAELNLSFAGSADSAGPDALETRTALLDREELAELDRHRMATRRRRHLVLRAMLRSCLARHSGGGSAVFSFRRVAPGRDTSREDRPPIIISVPSIGGTTSSRSSALAGRVSRRMRWPDGRERRFGLDAVVSANPLCRQSQHRAPAPPGSRWRLRRLCGSRPTA